jgi:hypothetical protein
MNESNSGRDPPKSKIPQQSYCWGASEILSMKEIAKEDIWDYCLPDPEDPEELEIEKGRPDRSK